MNQNVHWILSLPNWYVEVLNPHVTILETGLLTRGVSCSVMSDSFATPWTIACQAPLSVEFSSQEYWSGLPFHSPFKEMIKVKWGHKYRALIQWTWCLYQRKRHQKWTHKCVPLSAERTQWEGGHLQASRELSPETELAAPWSWTALASGIVGNKFLFELPSLAPC